MEGWPKSEATPSEDMLPRGGLNKDRHRLWSGQCQNFPGGKSGRLRPASALCGVFVSPPPPALSFLTSHFGSCNGS